MVTTKPYFEVDPQKLILDCTCSARLIWFVKDHPNAIFTDIRKEPKGFDTHRPNTEVCPDMQMDYRDLSFPDNTFSLVVWDPPHLKNLGKKSWFAKRYGSLKEMLMVIPDSPLFGHTTGSNSQTNWICFMKLPRSE